MWTSNEDWVLLYEECIYTVLTNELEVEHKRKHTEESKIRGPRYTEFDGREAQHECVTPKLSLWGCHTEGSAQADGWMNLGSREGLGLETNAGVLST